MRLWGYTLHHDCHLANEMKLMRAVRNIQFIYDNKNSHCSNRICWAVKLTVPMFSCWQNKYNVSIDSIIQDHCRRASIQSLWRAYRVLGILGRYEALYYIMARAALFIFAPGGTLPHYATDYIPILRTRLCSYPAGSCDWLDVRGPCSSYLEKNIYLFSELITGTWTRKSWSFWRTTLCSSSSSTSSKSTFPRVAEYSCKP